MKYLPVGIILHLFMPNAADVAPPSNDPTATVSLVLVTAPSLGLGRAFVPHCTMSSLTIMPRLALSCDVRSGVQVLGVKLDQGFSLVMHKYQVEPRSRLM